MGSIKVIRNDDGKPFISLEDLIKEIEAVKSSLSEDELTQQDNFLDVVLRTLRSMESEYYLKFLIRKDGEEDK